MCETHREKRPRRYRNASNKVFKDYILKPNKVCGVFYLFSSKKSFWFIRGRTRTTLGEWRIRHDAKNDLFKQPEHDDNGSIMKKKPNVEGRTRLEEKRVYVYGRLQRVDWKLSVK